jgi:hypothetical protein
VPEADDFNDFYFIPDPVKNPVWLKYNFTDVFIVLLGNHAAKTREICQMPDAFNQFSTIFAAAS